MILKKVFGETKETQMLFLKKRIILTVALTAFFVLAGLVNDSLLLLVFSISCYIWGWPAVKVVFKITSFAALFSTNFMIGVFLFVIGMIIAPIIGLVIMIIGVLNFVYLIIEGYKHG